MAEQHPTQLPHGHETSAAALREIFSEAIRYWERRRIVYNLVLVAVAAAWVGLTWPHFRHELTLHSLLLLIILATLANICYCAAYLVDVSMRYSFFESAWRRWRWTLWLVGMVLAIGVADYWIADEIYPYVR